MKPRSAKNKGLRASKELRESLLEVFPEISPEDIVCTPSGVNGSDLILSENAQRILDSDTGLDIEVKNVEKLSIWSAIDQAKARCGDKQPILVFRKNREKLHVCTDLEHFLKILRGASDARNAS